MFLKGVKIKNTFSQGVGWSSNNHRLGCPQEALCFHINLASYCSSDPRNVNVFTFPGRPLITKTPNRLSGFHPCSLLQPGQTFRFLMSEKHSSCASYCSTIMIFSEETQLFKSFRELEIQSCFLLRTVIRIYIRLSSSTLQIPTIVHRFS